VIVLIGLLAFALFITAAALSPQPARSSLAAAFPPSTPKGAPVSTLRWSILAVYALIALGLTWANILTGWPAYIAIAFLAFSFFTMLVYRR